jgi:hypothetical protein
MDKIPGKDLGGTIRLLWKSTPLSQGAKRETEANSECEGPNEMRLSSR